MARISMEPRPAASATAAPEMPAKIMLASTLTWAKPPRTEPTILAAKSKIRWVMPTAFMILAARMKNGTAISSKLWPVWDMIWGMERMSYPPTSMERMTDRPIAMETGTRSSMKAMKRMNSKAVIMATPPVFPAVRTTGRRIA